MTTKNGLLVQTNKTSIDVLKYAFYFLCLNILINIVDHFISLPYPHPQHPEPSPYLTFLFNPKDRFGDFFKLMDGLHIVKVWDGPVDYNANGLPFATAIYALLAKLILFTHSKYGIFIGIHLLLLSAIYFLVRKTGNNLQVFIMVAIVYPLLFAIDRGNIISIFVFLTLLITFRFKNLILFTLGIAVAASIRITPIIFIILFFIGKPFSFKDLVKVIVTLAVWLILINGLSIFINYRILPEGSYNLSVFFSSLNEYNSIYVANMRGLGYGSSLFMPMLWAFKKLHITEFFSPLVVPAAIGLLVILISLRKRSINQLIKDIFIPSKLSFILCISFVLFQPVTCDYYLLIMLIPVLLYPSTRYSFWYALIYGALLGAKNYPFIATTGGNFISLQVIVNPVLLLLLFLAEFDLIKKMKRVTPGEIFTASSPGMNQDSHKPGINI